MAMKGRIPKSDKSFPKPIELNAALNAAQAGKLSPKHLNILRNVLTRKPEFGADGKERPSAHTRLAVEEALGKVGDVAPAVQKNVGLLSHKNESVRVGAATALGIIGDPAAGEALEKAMVDSSERVRRAAKIAKMALKEIKG